MPDAIVDCETLKNLVEQAIHSKGQEIRLPSDIGTVGVYSPQNFAVRLVNCLMSFSDPRPESLIPMLFLATGAWTSWLLESKAIAHRSSDLPETEPIIAHPEMRASLLQVFNELERCALQMRNRAVNDKTSEKGRGEIPESIRIPIHYESWKEDAGYE